MLKSRPGWYSAWEELAILILIRRKGIGVNSKHSSKSGTEVFSGGNDT